ncbi:MAG: hypothetical protein F4Y45_04675 [Acidobacteria bacterium]|nr:hypothetical protein [Acidobacteriota bacterium]MXZ71475.1 hypothetical protein [Acidobacteriota bacterium]MYD70434.1 hypothetical protein [Acidobacteriota bacterium]
MKARPTSRVRQPIDVRQRSRAGRSDEELSESAIHAIEEGRADHAAGRTFTLDQIKRELERGS